MDDIQFKELVLKQLKILTEGQVKLVEGQAKLEEGQAKLENRITELEKAGKKG